MSTNIIKPKLSFDPLLIISIGLYSLFYLPFMSLIPYLDGNIDFVKSYDFFTGGFARLFQEWASVHPPLKEFITFPLFFLFGINRYTYTFPWLFFGILGIISLFSFVKTVSNIKAARMASLLLATSPLYLSVGIFGLTDFLLAVFIVAAMAQYVKKQYLWYSFFASLAILTKETAAIFCLSVLFIELATDALLIIKRKNQAKNYLYHLALISFPFVVFFLWTIFLKTSGKPLWSDWNFSETASRGSLYTIFNNLFQFKIFNKYAYQNWLHLFILNFNWFWWLLTFIGFSFLFIKKRSHLKSTLLVLSQKTKAFLIVIIFIPFYLVTTLSFQTYTITRYVLPLIPFLIIGVSISSDTLIKIFPKTRLLLFPTISLVIVLSLFFSVDPFSKHLWGIILIQKHPFYALHEKLAGNDGLTYNMQYLLLAKERTKKIMEANSSFRPVISQECQWIFPDPNNDKKTIRILHLTLPLNTPCTNQYAR
jgi:4-amino-4-deoxy-L-arabinose transferase-like glycosyltransferase